MLQSFTENARRSRAQSSSGGLGLARVASSPDVSRTSSAERSGPTLRQSASEGAEPQEGGVSFRRAETDPNLQIAGKLLVAQSVPVDLIHSEPNPGPNPGDDREPHQSGVVAELASNAQSPQVTKEPEEGPVGPGSGSGSGWPSAAERQRAQAPVRPRPVAAEGGGEEAACACVVS